MITPDAFNQLNVNEKAQITWAGKHLANRLAEEHIIQLYSLPDFYVEVFYQPETNAIIRIEAFKDLEQLAPYLGQLQQTER